jgi:hypothetical protein
MRTTRLDGEMRQLIRAIRDYAPNLKTADLERKTDQELIALYKSLRGY